MLLRCTILLLILALLGCGGPNHPLPPAGQDSAVGVVLLQLEARLTEDLPTALACHDFPSQALAMLTAAGGEPSAELVAATAKALRQSQEAEYLLQPLPAVAGITSFSQIDRDGGRREVRLDLLLADGDQLPYRWLVEQIDGRWVIREPADD